MGTSLEDDLRADAIELAIDTVGVDESDIIEGFAWVAYPGVSSGVRIMVFPRPIDAREFFDRVEDSILDRLAHRPSRGVRSAPSIPTHQYEKRSHAAYLSIDTLCSDVHAIEESLRLNKTGTSRLFAGEPQAGDLVSSSFKPSVVDRYVPQPANHRSPVPEVERFVRIDRFGSKAPGDLDIIEDPARIDRFAHAWLEQVTPRGYVCSIKRGRISEYRLRTVELVRDGLVDDHWYVDAHDVLRTIRTLRR
jgi:hypothetical protein